MNNLLLRLNSVHPLSQGLIDHLSTILITEEIKQHAFVLKPGRVSKTVYFIESGLFRGFYTKKRKELTSWFMKENDVMFSVASFLKQKPGTEHIQALEPSLVHSISYDQLQEIYKTFPEFNFIGRVLTENYYLESVEQLMITKAQKAIDRYQELKLTNQSLLQRVPLMHLASYLGMTATRLSMIRKIK